MREIYGHNFQWVRRSSIDPNDRMRMNYRFRCGLSRLWPYSNYLNQNG